MTTQPLVRHLALAVLMKLAVLFALWWAFVHGARLDVDAEQAADRLAAPAAASMTASPSAPAGPPTVP